MFSLSRLLSWPHRGKCDWTISRPHAYPPSNIPAPASQSPATRAAHTRGARPVPSRGRNQHRVASPGPEMLIGRSDAATPPRAHSPTRHRTPARAGELCESEAGASPSHPLARQRVPPPLMHQAASSIRGAGSSSPERYGAAMPPVAPASRGLSRRRASRELRRGARG